MDSVNRSAVTPSKSRLARTFAKVLHIRAATGGIPVDKVQKTKSREKTKHERVINDSRPKLLDEEDQKIRNRAVMEAFVAKLFASISSIKSAYAQLQYAQSPYDADGIQSADQLVVSELKTLSELKQSYLKKHIDDSSPETTQLLAEIQEQRSLLKTYDITGKKLDSQVKLKDSEITFLREKLEEANRENKLLDKRLNSSGPISPLDNLHFSTLSPSHFISALKQTIKSTRSFVRLMISEMESAGWDLDEAASSIEPGASFWSSTHKCYAFESFVCREMFDGFNFPNFSVLGEESSPNNKTRQQLFFDRYMELKSLKPKECIAWKPKSLFAKFCWVKYLRLIHSKMESSLLGNLNQRNLVNAGKYPETTFFAAFADMAKRVWLLHCLAFSFRPEASIFRVSNGSRFSEMFMASVNEEPFLSSDASPENDPEVGFTVVPGFKIGKTVIQSQVYLTCVDHREIGRW